MSEGPENRPKRGQNAEKEPRNRGNIGRARELFWERQVRLPQPPLLEAKMLKKLMISAAVSALMVSGALAQASPPAKSDAAPVDAAKFISSQSTDQWVFSRFKGTNVLGPDDAKVGDVNDMLLDKSGKIIGLIVGVGGFLGIGEKSVAIDMGAFHVVPASTGSTVGAGGGVAGACDNDPTNVKLKVSWTKDQLKAAPDFQYYRPPARTTSPTTGM